MRIGDITDTLLEKVCETIFEEWKHEGYIEIQHCDNFWFTLDGRLYKVTVQDVDAERPLTPKEREG